MWSRSSRLESIEEPHQSHQPNTAGKPRHLCVISVHIIKVLARTNARLCIVNGRVFIVYRGVVYRSLSRRQKVFEGVYLGILRMVVYVHYWIAVGGSCRNTEQSHGL